MARLLVSKGAEVNQQDQDLQTPLHYGEGKREGAKYMQSLLVCSPAVSCSHGDVVAFLVSIPSINKDMRDCDGATPTEVTSDPNIRVLLQK